MLSGCARMCAGISGSTEWNVCANILLCACCLVHFTTAWEVESYAVMLNWLESNHMLDRLLLLIVCVCVKTKWLWVSHLTVITLHMVVLVHGNYPDGFLWALERQTQSGRHVTPVSHLIKMMFQCHLRFEPWGCYMSSRNTQLPPLRTEVLQQDRSRIVHSWVSICDICLFIFISVFAFCGFYVITLVRLSLLWHSVTNKIAIITLFAEWHINRIQDDFSNFWITNC